MMDLVIGKMIINIEWMNERYKNKQSLFRIFISNCKCREARNRTINVVIHSTNFLFPGPSSFLTLSAERKSVLPDPPGPPGTPNGLGVVGALANTTRLLASVSQATELPVLVDSITDPVGLGIPSDGRMGDVHHDNLEVLVGRVLSNPVGVEDPQTLESPAHSLLRDGLEVTLGLLLLNSTRGLGFTIGTALGDWPLPTSTPHSNAVDDESLLGLVSQPASLVRPGRAGGTVDLR